MYLSCAHQAAPGGGPRDVEPPAVVRSIPVPGTLNFPVKGKITLRFSEWVDMRNVKKSVTIFPTLPDGFKISVSGRQVEIAPKKSFADSTTYHVGINTTLTDLHGVSVGTPFNLFFSTGSSIDSGIITGCVIDATNKNVQPKVAIYRCDGDSVHDSVFLQLPSYLTQTDSSGYFQFDHIRRGTYILCAFTDENNDNRITPGKDNAYAPRERKLSLEKEAGPFLLFPVLTDTLSATVEKIKAISATLISGEWVEGSGYGRENNEWTVISLDSTVPAPRIDRYIPIRNSKTFILKLADSLTTGSYSLIYTIHPRIFLPDDSTGSDTMPVLRDTLRFNGTVFPDTIPPTLKSTSPQGTVDLNSMISLTWSEPVRVLVDEWFITDSLQDTITLSVDTSFAEVSLFRPHNRLQPEKTYSFTVAPEYFEDLTGNTPRLEKDTSETDSTVADTTGGEDTAAVVSVTFSTVAAKDLCYSLSGGAECLETQPLRIWRFRPLNTQAEYTARDSGGYFYFDSIPGAKGTIGYFVDYNNDTAYSIGSLFPWIPPEPAFAFTDTVEARARWDIEGIAIPACDTCSKKIEHAAPPKETAVDTVDKEE